MNIVLIDRNNAEAYKDLILPSVYADLRLTVLSPETDLDTPIDCLCLGAEDESGPVGAIITLLEDEDGDTNILSLYVAPAKRRQGIAKELFRMTLMELSALYAYAPGTDEAKINILCDFSAPARQSEALEAFFRAVGATSIIQRPPLFEIRTADLKGGSLFPDGVPALSEDPAVKCIADLPAEEQEEILEGMDRMFDFSHSYLTGPADARESMVLIATANENVSVVLAAMAAPDFPQDDALPALRSAFASIFQDNPGAVIIAEPYSPETYQWYREIAPGAGEFPHTTAEIEWTLKRPDYL